MLYCLEFEGNERKKIERKKEYIYSHLAYQKLYNRRSLEQIKSGITSSFSSSQRGMLN